MLLAMLLFAVSVVTGASTDGATLEGLYELSRQEEPSLPQLPRSSACFKGNVFELAPPPFPPPPCPTLPPPPRLAGCATSSAAAASAYIAYALLPFSCRGVRHRVPAFAVCLQMP
jgi:hypothetical protein